MSQANQGNALSIYDLASSLMRQQAEAARGRESEIRKELGGDEQAIVRLILLGFEMQKAWKRDEKQDGGPLLEELLRRGEQILSDAGYAVEDFAGRELDDELRQMVEIVGYRHQEKENDSVDETLTPQIAKAGRILKTSTVIGASRDADDAGNQT